MPPRPNPKKLGARWDSSMFSSCPRFRCLAARGLAGALCLAQVLQPLNPLANGRMRREQRRRAAAEILQRIDDEEVLGRAFADLRPFGLAGAELFECADQADGVAGQLYR